MRFAQLVLTAAILAVLVAPGLRRADAPARPSAPASEPAAPPSDDLVPGERVVGRWQTGFYEGTVLDVRAELVTVAWDDGNPDHSHLPRGWVVRAGARAPGTAEGHWYLCGDRGTGTWQLCRAGEARFELIDGTYAVRGDIDAIDVPSGLLDWARAYGTRTLEAAQRRQQIARLAPATAGNGVEPGQDVLARWSDGNWWRATVERVRDGRVTVRWLDASGSEEVAAADVGILKPGGLEPGSFAICDWMGGARWWRATIDAVDGDQLTVHYIDETISQVSASNCVAAAPRSR